MSSRRPNLKEPGYNTLTWESSVTSSRCSSRGTGEKTGDYSSDTFETASEGFTSTYHSGDTDATLSSPSHASSAASVLHSPRQPPPYSGNTFESLTRTNSSDASDYSYSTDSFLSEQEDDKKEIEARETFLQNKLDNLRNREGKEQANVVEGPVEQLCGDSFIQQKIRLVKAKNKIGYPELPQTQHNFQKPPPDVTREECGIPSLVINRLKAENVKHALDKVFKTKIHNPRKCKSCRTKIAEHAQRDFVRMKANQVQEELLKERLEAHLYLRDPLTLIGDIMKDLPTLTDDPQQVWEDLMLPLRGKKETDTPRGRDQISRTKNMIQNKERSNKKLA